MTRKTSVPQEPEAAPAAEPAEPAVAIAQSDIIIANGTDKLPKYLLNWDETQARLRDPFDPDDIYFLPQTVNYSAGTAIAAAYADSRVYTARMNQVVGLGFWRSEVARVDIAPFTKRIKAKIDYKTKAILEPAVEVSANKVGVVARVGVWMGPALGWVFQESVGGKDTADENWNTSAEAQAYKRAMSKFGPGEYLYHFGKQECPYNTKTGKWTIQPVIPDFAYPDHTCDDCGVLIEHFTYTDKDGNAKTRHFWDIVVSTRNLYGGRKLCAACAKKARAAQTAAPVQERMQAPLA